MNILFLDVDGVLNSADFIDRMVVYGQIHGKSWTDDGGNHFIDPEAVKRVIHLCNNKDVKVVISSSWRYFDLPTTIESFKGYRDLVPLIPYIVGVTPRLKSGHRGTEIAQWLSEHPEVERYVIVDDDTDMTEEQMNGHFVQTDFDEGLDYQRVKQIRELFNQQR